MGNILDRFWSKVSESNDCWIWTASLREGYGQFFLEKDGERNIVVYAHRLSYEMFVGEIPSGLQIDHLCGERRCVNPNHLEAVTQHENLRRSGRRVASRECCRMGHQYSESNTYIKPNGVRRCRTCFRIAKERRTSR